MQGGRMNELLITSLQNRAVKETLKLRERRHRDESNLFLIEGYRELLRASEAEWPVQTLWVCKELFLGSNEEALIKRLTAQGANVIQASPQVFQKISYRDRPDGLLGISPQKHYTFHDLKKKGSPFFIVAEAIEKPGNLGTLLRSADAAGVDAIILCDRRTDIFNPTVVRASVGTLFTVPVVEVSTEEALKWLKEQGIIIAAATPSAKEEFTDADLNVPLAIAVGTEQLGLSEVWLQEAAIQVRIPMLGKADSLNVATAATLLMYETIRQRRKK
jgi:TrmH family RNA methyltransferase